MNVSRYSVVNHVQNDAYGFSATLFKNNLSSKLVLAIRGSEGDFLDFIPTSGANPDRHQANADIVLPARGIARDQLVSLYNYYRRLITPVDQEVPLYRLVDTATLPESGSYYTYESRISELLPPTTRYVYLAFDRAEFGLEAIEAGTQLVLTGHSLGGHLAMAFSRLFPGAVSEVVTFNAAGFGKASLEVDKLFGLFAGQMGVPVESLAAFPETKISNVYAYPGPEIVTNSLAMRQPGERIPAYVEENISSLTALHSISRLTDAFSLYETFDLLGSLEGGGTGLQKVSALSPVFAASSADAERTLETILDSMRRLFRDWSAAPQAPTPIGDRDKFYEHLADLSTRLEAYAGQTALVALPDLDAYAIAYRALADDGIAYRYALQELQPYAVLGPSGLYQGPNADQSLDLLNPDTGLGQSEQWIWARSLFLDAKVWHHTSDGQLPARALGGYFLDRESGLEIGTSAGSAPMHVFAADGSAAPLEGNGGDDFLFGGSGAESLSGAGGRDYLEGGLGSDALSGGAGADVLIGGQGDDILSGGEGDDFLEGGVGFDIYVYESGGGFDEIADADGLGRIRYKGRELGGGLPGAAGVYLDAGGTEYIVLGGESQGLSLLISGEILIAGFRNGMLGIVLDGLPELVAAPDTTAEHTYLDEYLPQDAVLPVDPQSGDAEVQRQYRYAHDRVDVGLAFGSAVADRFITSGGVAYFGRQGDDSAEFQGNGIYDAAVDGGADDDLIDFSTSAGGAGNAAALVGGGGEDYILGSAGQDSIWGDNQRVFVGTVTLPDGESRTEVRIDGVAYRLGDSALSPEAPESLVAGYAVHTVAGPGAVVDAGVLDAVLVPTGVAISGTLEEAIRFVLGEDAGFDDFVSAGGGDDVVVGGSGADELHGDEGHDTLYGDYLHDGSGTDPTYAKLSEYFGQLSSLFGRPGDDRIHGGAGNDLISDRSGGNDILSGEAGDDHIQSSEDRWDPVGGVGARNVIEGGDGNDRIEVLNPTGGLDVVDGGEGDDVIEVIAERYVAYDADGVAFWGGETPGRVFVRGGQGNDVLTVTADAGYVDGGEGDDFYDVVGNLIISDAGGADSLVAAGLFPAESYDALFEGFSSSGFNGFDAQGSVAVRRSGRDLEFGFDALAFNGEATQTGYRIRIEDWFADASNRIENVLLGDADGVAVTAEVFAALGATVYGSREGDLVDGYTEYADRLMGFGGNDLIFAGAGNDRLNGGLGDDELHGGEGNDTYFYALGDGNDRLQDDAGVDEIRFGSDIRRQDVQVVVESHGARLVVGAGSIELADGWSAGPSIERLRFEDGSTLALDEAYLSAMQAYVLPAPEPVETEVVGSPPIAGNEGDAQTQGSAREVASSGVGSSMRSWAGFAADAATDPTYTGIEPSTFPDANGAAGSGRMAELPARELPGSRSTATATAPIVAQEGIAGDAPLDLHSLTEAIAEFERTASAPGLNQHRDAANLSSQGANSFDAREPVPGLSGWELTNALLQFHLEQSTPDDLGAGPAAPFVPRLDALPGLGLGAALDASVSGEFSSLAQRLQPFQGLREGIANLGAF